MGFTTRYRSIPSSACRHGDLSRKLTQCAAGEGVVPVAPRRGRIGATEPLLCCRLDVFQRTAMPFQHPKRRSSVRAISVERPQSLRQIS